MLDRTMLISNAMQRRLLLLAEKRLHLWPWIAVLSTGAVLGGMLFVPAGTVLL